MLLGDNRVGRVWGSREIQERKRRKRIPKRPRDAEGVRMRAVRPTEAESSASVWSDEGWVPVVPPRVTVLPIGWEEEGLEVGLKEE